MATPAVPPRERRCGPGERTENCVAYALRLIAGGSRSDIAAWVAAETDHTRRRRVSDATMSINRWAAALEGLGFTIEYLAMWLSAVGWRAWYGAETQLRHHLLLSDSGQMRPALTFGSLQTQRPAADCIVLGVRHAWAVLADGTVIDGRAEAWRTPARMRVLAIAHAAGRDLQVPWPHPQRS